MAGNIEQKLKVCTGHLWKEVKPSYLDFHLQNNKSRGQMCVFTPSDNRQSKSRFFIPDAANSHELRKPDVFLQKYLNAKEKVIRNMPWVKFDLDQLPPLSGAEVVPSAEGFILIKYEIKLTGDLKIRSTKSANNQTIGTGNLKNIAYNSRIELVDFIQTWKANFNFASQTLSLGYSLKSEFGSTSFTLSPNSITAEYTPSGNVLKFNVKGYEIETQLGYSLSGTWEPIQQPPASHLLPHIHWQPSLAEKVLLGIGVVALILFTDGVAAPILLA